MKTSNLSSPSSSPPTPPSPLPVSVGPGNHKYPFSPSPSLSPPFSPASHPSSAEATPLLQSRGRSEWAKEPSAFSLDKLLAESNTQGRWQPLKFWLEWLMLRICCCCSSFS